jgi:beta-galactosidase GanA
LTFSFRVAIAVTFATAAAVGFAAAAQERPRIKTENGVGQLQVGGKPFLILGGELGNSSAGTAAEADTILPRLAAIHVNSVLVPVAWEEIEATENHFDFSILDHWIDIARQEHLRLVILWFGSWKNAFSNYTPEWVKADTRRFPRAHSPEGLPLEILSTFGEDTRKCDARAFAALARHLGERDSREQTVLFIQLENEVGILGSLRDYSEAATRAFALPVPLELKRKLEGRRVQLSGELARHFQPEGKTWSEVFGEAASEVFTAYQYACFMNAVAQAGKKEYPLLMYANAQLPAPFERPGEYPSGGPHPYYQDVYRVAAPALDFYSPDIYWPNFEYWVERYTNAGNPAFIPEARAEASPFNALWAYGQARAFGFSPFGIDSIATATGPSAPKPSVGEVYRALDQLSDLILQAQRRNESRGLVLHVSSPRATQTVSLGGYLVQGTLSRSWPARNLLTDDGAMIILQSKPNEFFIAGSGLTVTFTRDPDVDGQVAGISRVEQVSRTNGGWTVNRVLNGDQTNQGRQLTMAAHEVQIFRVRLYSYPRLASDRAPRPNPDAIAAASRPASLLPLRSAP